MGGAMWQDCWGKTEKELQDDIDAQMKKARAMGLSDLCMLQEPVRKQNENGEWLWYAAFSAHA